MIDLRLALTAAKLSRAAYGDAGGQREEMAALGVSNPIVLTDRDGSAVVGGLDGFQVIAVSGTHFTEKTRMSEIADNILGDPVDIGAQVHDGYWGHALRLWWQIAPVLPAGPIILTGHSLGGTAAHLLPYFLPRDRAVVIATFGAPRAADLNFWSRVVPGRTWARFEREKDFAPAWPEFGPFRQPGKALWLHGGVVDEIDERPGINDSIADHSIDLYVADLEKLATKQPIAAQ